MYCCLPGFVAAVVRRIQHELPAVLEFCPDIRRPMPVSCIRRHPGCADAAVDVLKDTVQPGTVCFVALIGVLNNQWMPVQDGMPVTKMRQQHPLPRHPAGQQNLPRSEPAQLHELLAPYPRPEPDRSVTERGQPC